MLSLQAKIMEVEGSLPRDTMVKACSRFRQRIEVVVDAGGFLFIVAACGTCTWR